MKKKNIMIVEDEALVALKIKNDLLKMGHIVIGIYASGEDALASIGQSAPDLVLMDIQLQGKISGIETADIFLKEHDIPVIFLTAHSDEDTIRKAMATAPYGYLLKPVENQELHVTIEVALHKHRIDKEKDQLARELKHALEEVKTLKGLIPICASCKKIRDDEGFWNQLETYISKHSDAKFTHGICPDCIKKLYPDFTDKQ